MNKLFYFLFSASLFAISCGKDTEVIQPEPVKQRQLKADSKKFFEGTCQIITSGGEPTVGIHCVRSFSNNCKRLKPCEPLVSIFYNVDIGSFFTQEELDNWENVDLTTKGREFKIAMWEADWFYHPDSLPEE